MLVIIDAKPKDLGLPTEAYVAVEEVHDVSIATHFNSNLYIMGLQYDVYQGQFNSRLTGGVQIFLGGGVLPRTWPDFVHLLPRFLVMI